MAADEAGDFDAPAFTVRPEVGGGGVGGRIGAGADVAIGRAYVAGAGAAFLGRIAMTTITMTASAATPTIAMINVIDPEDCVCGAAGMTVGATSTGAGV